MITDYIGGEGSAETPKNDYVIYGWPLMANAIPYGKGTVSPISATLKEGLVPKDIIWVNLVFMGPDR